MRECGLHFLLISHLPNIRYITGFTGSSALVLVGHDQTVLYTDGRYATQARQETQGCELVIAAFSHQLYESLRENRFVTADSVLGFESANVTVSMMQKLKTIFPGVFWQPVESLIEPIRQRKIPEELRCIREAVRITEKTFERILPEIRPGTSEARLAAMINYQLRLNGASKEAFDTIVASGINSSMPHARPTGKILQEGEFVILDFGAVYEGYHADMTRTVYIGSPGVEEMLHYDAVFGAQKRAMEFACAGVTAKNLDSAARNYLKKKSLDPYFTHSLGHGIGLEIHESPILSQASDQVLPEALVCTIEPGIYIPGRYGIRIENDVCLRNWGCQNLMTLPADLITVPA